MDDLQQLRQDFEEFKVFVKKGLVSKNLTGATLDLNGDSAPAPLDVSNSVVTETNFKKIGLFGTVTIFISDGTSPDTNLTGVVGDICLGCDSGKAYYCSVAGKNDWIAF